MLQPLVIPQKNTQTLYIKSDDYTFQTGDEAEEEEAEREFRRFLTDEQ